MVFLRDEQVVVIGFRQPVGCCVIDNRSRRGSGPDNVLICLWALRSTEKRVGVERVRHHWKGSDAGLAKILAGSGLALGSTIRKEGAVACEVQGLEIVDPT